MKNKSRLIWGAVLLVLLAAAAYLFLFPETLLVEAGGFLAPTSDGQADTVILEGAESVEAGAVMTGMDLLSSGRARRMVVVIHQPSEKKKLFALGRDYPEAVRKGLKDLGLRDDQFVVMSTPARHPITLTEAAIVMEALSREGVRSAVLLANGFHTRRSFLVYRHAGEPQINVMPLAYFDEYGKEDWWKHEAGLRDFLSELFKLAYYRVMGYIPTIRGSAD